MEVQEIVLDTSTLILLAKVDLLQSLAERLCVLVPEGVRSEALAKPHAYDAQLIGQMIEDKRIHVVEAVSFPGINRLRKDFRIETAEAVTLVLARAKHCTVGIDDGPGIRAAKILGIPFVTAIHVLLGLHGQRRLSDKAALTKLEGLEMWGRYRIELVQDARSRIEKGR